MKRGPEKLSKQVKRHSAKPAEISSDEYKGNFDKGVILTGSTLLDCAISSGIVYGGGVPGGILIENSGLESSGKTVLLCETAGAVQRQGGETKFRDPEARLNEAFAKIFDFQIEKKNYSRPSQVIEIFEDIPNWVPQNPKVINGLFADSLAALSTEMEMTKKEGDKMGGRRGKDFSEQLRKTCRILADKNYLMMCSNQLRDNFGAGQFEPKYVTPGGHALAFYASLRLRHNIIKYHKKTLTIRGRETEKVIGVDIRIDVIKSSLWKPKRSADLTIIFDYGIDDIRQNLQFIKNYSPYSVYTLNNQELHKSMDESIQIIEEDHLESELKKEVIDLWMEIEKHFESNRTKKVRV